ncbi:LacI family DNA-binding transcriptional regulator [Saccharopolyspora erythraea]|uniref:LacI family DNA-binding transcriptional regulator n=1 Tax=Saccharopolyspora erythraea TaxID=1836 RepID=UPI00201220DD|nr:LacI family DNA-binding transcriptional regulator [Saccharopolyspora erythraea]
MNEPPTERRRDSARDRRPTMADVAARAGVSRALVSLVFRGLPGASAATRERVFKAADELGYRPDTAAQLLARGRSRTLGVMLTVHQPFHADLVEAIYPAAEQVGYEVLLSASAPVRDETKAVEALLSHRCEGLILLGTRADARWLNELGQRTATAIVGRRLPGAHVDSVHTADALGIRQAVDHLVELGHRTITHVDGGQAPAAADRRRAYRAAMRAHHLAEHVDVLRGNHTEDAGIEAGHTLLARDRLPTAVLAGNDRCAIGLIGTLLRAGVDVPGEVSVVGYDDSHISHLLHDLTTVSQDALRMGEHAVRSVVRRLDDDSLAPDEIVLEPKLVVRNTSAPPRDGSTAR